MLSILQKDFLNRLEIDWDTCNMIFWIFDFENSKFEKSGFKFKSGFSKMKVFFPQKPLYRFYWNFLALSLICKTGLILFLPITVQYSAKNLIRPDSKKSNWNLNYFFENVVTGHFYCLFKEMIVSKKKKTA